MKEQVNKWTYVFRFLSALFVIFIVVPIYFIGLVINSLFEIVNGFTYNKFIKYTLPDGLFEKTGLDYKYLWFVKILTIIMSPIIKIPFSFYSAVKSIKL